MSSCVKSFKEIRGAEQQTTRMNRLASDSLAAQPPPCIDGPQIRFDWNEPFNDVPALDEATKSGDFESSAERIGMLLPLASSDGDLFGLQQEEEEEASKNKSLTVQAQQQQRSQELKRGIGFLLPQVSSRRKKKSKNLPKRPLSAYNLYFRQQTADLNAEGNVKVGFHELGKIVGKKWQALADGDRSQFEELALKDSGRYKREMDEHKKREVSKEEEEMKEKAASGASFPPLGDRRSIMSGNYGPHFGGVPPPQNYGPSYGNYQYLAPFGPSAQPPYGSMPPSWSGPPSQFAAPPQSYSFDLQHGQPGMQPTLMEGQPKDGRPVPPGSQVQIRDENGELRKYTVQYAMVTMSRQEAKDYIEQLKRN